MRGVSALVTIAAAMAIGWAGAAQAASQTTDQRVDQWMGQWMGQFERRSASPEPGQATVGPERSASLQRAQTAIQPTTIQPTVIQIRVAEAPLLPSGRSRSNPTRPSSSRSRDSDQNFQYRLIVQGSSDSLLRQVRQTVPDAFRTRIGSQRAIQAGLFVTREEAEAVQQQLSRLDLETQILEIEDSISSLPRRGASPSNRSGQAGSQSGYQYRLVVQGSSDSLLRQVRRIAPDAFRTRIDGQRVVQAGLFVTREEAEAVQRQLAQIDAPSSIFDINYGVAQRSTQQPRSRVPNSRTQGRAQDGRTVIVIDPGHGGGDPGAVGIGGIHEADIVLSIAQQVAELLEAQGVQAVLTRSDDREVELEPRVELADSVGADLFVSIHANAISLSRPDVNGIETYYYDTGESLATSIHNSLVAATGMADRGVRQARFYVLTQTSMPAVLVEVGFVTGREDAARFQSATARSQIAAAIAQGILRYIR